MFRPVWAIIKAVPSLSQLITGLFLKHHTQFVLNFVMLYPYLSKHVVIKLYLPACTVARNATTLSSATRKCFLASIVPVTFETLLIFTLYRSCNSINLHIPAFQISISHIFLSQPKIINHSDLSTHTVALSTKYSGKLPQGCYSTLKEHV